MNFGILEPIDIRAGLRLRNPQTDAPCMKNIHVCMYTDIYMHIYLGGCQNYGPFLGTLNIRCRTIIGTQKGTIILTTTHIYKQIHTTHTCATCIYLRFLLLHALHPFEYVLVDLQSAAKSRRRGIA